MTTASTAVANCQIRTYCRSSAAVFLKTREQYGGLSNMAGGFPLCVNGVAIRSSEALYQACRFPYLPDVQRLIIEQISPMSAKMKGKPYRRDSRPDWDNVRIKIMRWCLRVKLAQNWETFSKALLETGDLPIVEHSRRDDFWGAKPVDGQTLTGVNALGRLLMQLREWVKQEPKETLLRVEPLPIGDFLLYDDPIEAINPNLAGRYLTPEEPNQYTQMNAFPFVVAERSSEYTTIDATAEDLININKAAANDLETLPHIGPKLSQAIISHREENGPFQTEHDIAQVRGISKRTYQRIADRITAGHLAKVDVSSKTPGIVASPNSQALLSKSFK